MSEDLHATRRRSLDASAADRFRDVRRRVERMLDPPGAYTSERARAMITIQAASESTTIEKIAARNEKRSVRRLSVTPAATGAAISACGSLGIPRSLPARRTAMRPVVLSNMAAHDGPSCILANADLSASALCRGASRSSSDIGGSRILTTAAASENARQRRRDPVLDVVRGDRNDGGLVSQHDLRNARTRHSDNLPALPPHCE